MSFDQKKLYELLPAIYRIRDEEQGKPLWDLLSIIAGQISELEEDMEQLYDDQFIETCAEWVIPYIGDLIGYRPLHGKIQGISSPRSEVANTIAYRQRKGTAAVLEQIACDVTGWNARVVEFFQLLASTQHMNHIRHDNIQMPDLRHGKSIELLDTPFDNQAHTVDVRSIASGRGRYNIPNIGIFLWRLKAYRLKRSPAFKVDDQLYMFSPLGNNMQLFTRPQAEETITHIAEPINVSMPISRRMMKEHLEDYYGKDKSIFIDGFEADDVLISDLSDMDKTGTNSFESIKKTVAIDPELGRIAFFESLENPPPVTFHYGFSMDMGGGEYDRSSSFEAELEDKRQIINVCMNRKECGHKTIQNALKELGDKDGIIEITDNGRYEDYDEKHGKLRIMKIKLKAGQRIELRAANKYRPIIVLKFPFEISGDDAELTLNGLLIGGCALQVNGGLKKLRLCHCTLVPGLCLSREGTPENFRAPSLILENGTNISTAVEIDHCIIGPLRLPSEQCTLDVRDSIIDSPGSAPAIIAPYEGGGYGPSTKMERVTVMGTVNVKELVMCSNVIFTGRVRTYLRQSGCVRFSYVPIGSEIPRSYRCELGKDADTSLIYPAFTSRRYGNAAYCQLSRNCASEIRQGADDDSEMGAFHDLYQPQRAANLRIRLDEYLRFGLEAGIFYIN